MWRARVTGNIKRSDRLPQTDPVSWMNRYLKTNGPLFKMKLSLQTSLFKKMLLFTRDSFRKIYRCLYVMVKWILSLLWCCYYCIMSDAERRRPVEHYCYEGNATKSNMLGNVFDLQIFFCRIHVLNW